MKTFKNTQGDTAISLKPNICIFFYNNKFKLIRATANDVKTAFGYNDAPEVLDSLNIAQKAFLAGVETFMMSFKSEEERLSNINALLLYALLNSVDVIALFKEVKHIDMASIASYICRMFRVYDITDNSYLNKAYWAFFNGDESDEFFYGIMKYFEK